MVVPWTSVLTVTLKLCGSVFVHQSLHCPRGIEKQVGTVVFESRRCKQKSSLVKQTLTQGDWWGGMLSFLRSSIPRMPGLDSTLCPLLNLDGDIIASHQLHPSQRLPDPLRLVWIRLNLNARRFASPFVTYRNTTSAFPSLSLLLGWNPVAVWWALLECCEFGWHSWMSNIQTLVARVDV